MRYHERYVERHERALSRLINVLLITVAILAVTVILLVKAVNTETEIEEPEPVVRVVREEPAVTAAIAPDEVPQATQNAEAALPDYIPTWDELQRLAKLVYGEARGVESQTEQAAVIWVALNRIDAGYGDTVTEVVHAAHFKGYNPDNPLVDDYGRDLEELAADVASRWLCEKMGDENVGRVIPPDYLWFTAVDGRNIFRNAYVGGEVWGWNWASPYDS